MRHELNNLVFRLRQLRRQAAPYEARCAVLPALRAQAAPASEFETCWLTYFEGQTAARLAACGAGPQLLPEARTAGLEREADLLGAYLAAPVV